MAREREKERGRSREKWGDEKEARKGEHRGSSSEDLDEREYTDEKGDIRHHTRKYMEGRRGG